jgi:hypothetical protein
MDQLARLEAELGIPVISSNSATLWLGLRLIEAQIDRLPLGSLYGLDPTWTIYEKSRAPHLPRAAHPVRNVY